MLFLVIAALLGVMTIVAAAAPGPYLNCGGEQRCRSGADAANLLPDETLARLKRDTKSRGQFDRWVAEPGVRVGLAAIVLLESGPMAVLFLAVGMALRRLGQQRHHALAEALPWLRRASRAAITLAVARIVCPVLQAGLLYNGVGGSTALSNPIQVDTAFLLLLLAFAAYATIWALEAGIRAERELADFV
ncbi:MULTISPECIES: hypothetical protein [unclassified Sphingomonas]|uniref:hypothetical protein n=1 Tax=unclassified Sphingomonas TaxID=196159 RepID=UPI0006F1FA8B|nr:MULTISPECIES: hypothetical protein [unclassified Sphingomonas]KQM28915.1 hypothetical protein ASE58_03435 [Sphingomonas sp. Leaf9]KQM45616.1 hypothetical protein ASE57_03425 [Sphingomonas sp. Leaf11]